VAIHYGQLILGVIGSQERMECTVISDAVNVASRLESMNKTYGTSLLISDIALSQCQQVDQYHKRILDKVRFYGKGSPNVVYEIFGYKYYILNEKLNDIVEFFELGISFYQNKDFVNALQQFRKCLKIYPNDKPSQFYVQRCTDYLVHGTPPDWDGIFYIEK
jgi:adenylate cyclase